MERMSGVYRIDVWHVYVCRKRMCGINVIIEICDRLWENRTLRVGEENENLCF